MVAGGGLAEAAFSAVVATKSAEVHSRMSQSADSTCADSRSGVPDTRRWTWEADRSMPRPCSSETSSVALNIRYQAITSRSRQE